MDVFFLILILVIFYKAKVYKRRFNYHYLDKNNTLCINGIFVVLIFLSHILSYCSFEVSSSTIYEFFHLRMEQLVVVSFLFYSGYGVIESIRSKDNYVDNMPKKRLLKLYIMFILAIFSFLVVDILLGIHYDIKTICLSFIGWMDIGNSNWYIFTIMFMYFFTYISFKTFKEEKISIWIVTILTALYIYYLGLFKYNFWYNTALCFPLGMWMSFYKEKIEYLFMNDNRKYLFIFILLLLFFYITYRNHNIGVMYYELWSINFILIVLFGTMKVCIYNKILLFFGKYTFWIYILQRLPMIIFHRIGLHMISSYLYVVLCFIATIFLSIIYDKISKIMLKKFSL